MPVRRPRRGQPSGCRPERRCAVRLPERCAAGVRLGVPLASARRRARHPLRASILPPASQPRSRWRAATRREPRAARTCLRAASVELLSAAAANRPRAPAWISLSYRLLLRRGRSPRRSRASGRFASPQHRGTPCQPHSSPTRSGSRPVRSRTDMAQAAARLAERRFRGRALCPSRRPPGARTRRRRPSIANRLGWLTSPERDGSRDCTGSRRLPDSVTRDGFTDVVLLGMGGSSLAPEVLRAVIGVSPGRPRFTMVDSVNPDHLPDDRHRPAPHAVRARQQVGIDDRAERARRLLPPAADRRRDHAMGDALRGHHRPGHRARPTRGDRGVSRRVPQPARHRRALLRDLVLRPRSGGAHGRATSRAWSATLARCSTRPAHPTSAPTPRSALGALAGAGALARPRQAHADRAAARSSRSGSGSNSSSPSPRGSRARASCRSPGEPLGDAARVRRRPA